MASLVLAVAGSSAFAQAAAQGQSSAEKPAPAASKIVPEDIVPGQAAPGGIQSQNIFDVKPEVKRDAPSDPGYLQQNNGQRNRVQPGNNSPAWRGVHAGQEGFTNYPRDTYPEAGVAIQPQVRYPGSHTTTAGQAWRETRNLWILPYGGSLLLIALVALAIMWFARGEIGHNPAVGGGGRRIERFTPFERAAHWTNAIAFSVLAISGLVMAFGKFLLLPLMGGVLFGWLTYVLKNLHNFFGPLFAVSLVIVFITFVRSEFPERGDLRWLLHAGGVFRRKARQGVGDELPAGRFNAGEKVVFWIGVLILGFVVVASGLFLDKVLPSMDYVRGNMQLANMVHATFAVLMMCVFAVHIYLGTIGYKGAYDAMRHGYVDEAWAKEHHAYWLEDIHAGKVPAERSKAQPVVRPSDETVRPA
ncbi:MAG TPA: formate dehydrogenase subunit gamma [Ramlibacter sp.]|uniref:formate dehydrogenase subunit gamma n=1 Tax=Ramlibacter sp. TaxID=1917967 RepID=UPI002B869CE4|nr:formate dehydrogenase subunit gamma [Ramlibacter sp.]HVZ45457.1 formate dehydrogenase subunit gamma [Ramlibacter sp.]